MLVLEPRVVGRCGVQDFSGFKAELDATVTQNPDYKTRSDGSHIGLIYKYAAIGDSVNSPWNDGAENFYIKANFSASFAGELVLQGGGFASARTSGGGEPYFFGDSAGVVREAGLLKSKL